MDAVEAVFAFDADGTLTVFPTLDAARQAAASGVLAAPHTGIYTAEGVPLRLCDGDLLLGVEAKLFALQQRLAEYQRHLPVVPEEVDVVTFAAAWLASNRR